MLLEKEIKKLQKNTTTYRKPVELGE